MFRFMYKILPQVFIKMQRKRVNNLINLHLFTINLSETLLTCHEQVCCNNEFDKVLKDSVFDIIPIAGLLN